MADAVANKLEQLRSQAGLEGDGGWELLDQLRDGVEPRLVRTRPQQHSYSGGRSECSIHLVHYACQHGWLDFLYCLIQGHNCDPHAATQRGVTPLHYACRHGWFTIVCYLISKQHCNPHAVTKGGEAPLHYCCQHGHFSIVRYLISKQHCNPHAVTLCGQTPLHYACRHGHFAIVRYLISEQHCNPQAKTLGGQTPLHWACGCGSLDIVRYLISEQHCNPECCDNEQRTPLHWLIAARRQCTREALKFLISIANCDVSKRDQHGNTALHAACHLSESGKSRYLRCMRTFVTLCVCACVSLSLCVCVCVLLVVEIILCTLQKARTFYWKKQTLIQMPRTMMETLHYTWHAGVRISEQFTS